MKMKTIALTVPAIVAGPITFIGVVTVVLGSAVILELVKTKIQENASQPSAEANKSQ